ncbi:MAG TPA: hypothetical protein VM939_12415, partial [Gemmatimonadaceae bacterium]|nr:hypothetical protein [Gemmatimonadaceae bacterium]
AGRSRFSDWVFRVTNAFASAVGGRLPLPDSPALWIITLMSPLLMLWGIANVWPTVDSTIWGLALLSAGLVAYMVRSIGTTPDAEVEHVWVTGSALWTLFGVLWIADGAGPALRISADSLMIGFASLHAAIVLQLDAVRRYGGPRKLAYITVGLCLLAVLMEETSSIDARAIPWSRTIAELVVVGAAALVWMRLRTDEKARMVGVLFGLGAYIALLLIVNRVLGAVWQPLVTTTYAIAGTALLIASKRVADGSVLRKLGGLTMLLVVFRLFVIDLADVETIWRVVLFMLCGLLFLYTSYRLQPEKAVPPAS